MYRRHSWLALILASLLFVAAQILYCVPALAASEEERILSFDSDIVIHPDASMQVTETIRVLAQGYTIKRGIIREFPTRYKDAEGNRVEVGFRLKEVRRDGVPERREVSRMFNGVSIRIGDPDVYLTPGEYTYTIIYTTTRQLGFFQGYDELYWNVTGTGWDLPIDYTSATVHLPDGVDGAEIKTTAYTGAYGTHGSAYRASVEGNTARFESTVPFLRFEGLTIVEQWPQGFVQRPTKVVLAGYWLARYISLLLGLAGLFAAVFYYWLAWRRVGVDPPSGFITPRDTPPSELSPVALRYVTKMGLDNKGFTTALISLAAKGAIRIEGGKKNKYTLVKLGEPTATLAAEEAQLLEGLFRSGDTIVAEQDNWQVFAAAQSSLQQALDRQFQNVYFKRNTGEFLVGLALTGGTFFLLLVLVIATQTILSAVVLGSFFLLSIILSVLFGMLMPAYTMLGRGLLDGIEGFKLALVGGADEYGEEHPGSRVLIEKYLPYAVALEVHNQWSQRFERALAQREQHAGRSDAGPVHYMPAWYVPYSHDHTHSYTSFNHFTSSFTSSFNSSISASSSAPGSSSGGSGGSSGGGGGGGGGGGW